MTAKLSFISCLLVTVTVVLGNSPAPSPMDGAACTHKTPLKKGVPGSPGHLIQLPQREPGVTELAAVMRTMYEAMKVDKAAIGSGQKRPTLPNFSRISCAWPTDMSIRGPTFDALATPTFVALKAHEASPSKKSFNALVDACVSCHRAMCPGPIAALNGLYFETTTGQSTVTEPQECDSP